MRGIDGLIFDVDGVLLDVSNSYFPMMQEVLRIFSEKFPDHDPSSETFSPEHLRAVKQHPAFNDDYDIPWAFLAFWHHCLRKGMGTLPEVSLWKGALHACPPEPQHALEWIRTQWGEAVPREHVRQLCDRLYFGEAYSRVRPQASEAGLGKGFWREERALVHRSWKSLPLPCAIYTGRPRSELDLVLEQLGWTDFPRHHTVTLDDGILKPSPRGLSLLAQRLGASHPLYFGDAESDLLAYRAFGQGGFVAVGNVLTAWRPRYQRTDDALQDILSFFPNLQQE